MIKRVSMEHPGTGGKFDAPERAVKHYERAGWVVVEDQADDSQTDSPAGDAKDGADTGSGTTSGRKSATAKKSEEGK